MLTLILMFGSKSLVFIDESGFIVVPNCPLVKKKVKKYLETPGEKGKKDKIL